MPAAPSRSRRDWLWPVAWAGAIFLESAQAHVPLPNLPESDKVVHFLAYGLLATLICRLGRGWKAAVVGALLASAYGATDEWHQYFVPGRSCDVWDWVADTAGAMVAVTVYNVWPWYRRMLEQGLRPGQGKTNVERPTPDAERLS
ncbi:MAG TPA: VanZ family protein [Opitutaceae bacterium]|nr:VanZ family protein [Opitutaceae bacterium]HND61885.1 VanZ family protein [Opitutaceae bacterium]